MRINTLRAFVALALVVASCATSPPVTKGGHKFAATQTISASYDPSVSGLPGNVGDIVSVAGGATAWVKSGTGVTAWSAFPSSGISAGDQVKIDSIQPSDNVAITGGSILGVNVATSSAQGAMSAADKATVDTNFGWARASLAALATALPTATHPRVIPIGGFTLPTNGVDAATDGSTWTSTAGNIVILSGVVTVAPKSGEVWAFIAEAKLQAPTTGKAANFGLFNVGATHAINFGSDFAGSTTKFILRIHDGVTPTYSATSAAADTSFHVFMVFSNGTTIRLYIDGVDTTASLAASLVNSNENCRLFFAATDQGAVVVRNVMFVGP